MTAAPLFRPAAWAGLARGKTHGPLGPLAHVTPPAGPGIATFSIGGLMLITLLEAILLGLAAIHVSLTIAFAGVATPALFRTVRRVNRRKRDGEFPGNVWTALVFSASVLIVVRTVSSRIFSLVKAVLTVAIAVERRLGFVRHSPRYLGLAIWCLAAAAMSCRRLMKRGPRLGRLCMKRVVQGMAIGPVEATAL